MPKANVGEISLDYELRGQGPPLLMINGFRRSRVVWMEPVLAPLAEHFTLILYDNRGTGHSDKPEGGYSIEAFADDGAALLKSIGIEKAHVFGVSMGGMIAQRIATRHPQSVRGLALGCTACGGERVAPPSREIWELLRLLPNEEMDAREVARRQEKAYFTDGFQAAHRPLLDELFALVNEHPTPEFAVKGHLAAIEAFDGSADLASIAAPTLVITGDSDALIVPENSSVLADGIPDAHLKVLGDSGHFFWVDHPRETAQALSEFFGKLGE